MIILFSEKHRHRTSHSPILFAFGIDYKSFLCILASILLWMPCSVSPLFKAILFSRAPKSFPRERYHTSFPGDAWNTLSPIPGEDGVDSTSVLSSLVRVNSKSRSGSMNAESVTSCIHSPCGRKLTRKKISYSFL